VVQVEQVNQITPKKRSLENIHFEKEKKKEQKPLEKDEIAKDFMAQQQ
jgi:hypothetical protein